MKDRAIMGFSTDIQVLHDLGGDINLAVAMLLSVM